MKMIQSVYEFLISSFVKKFLPKFHVSKEMKRSTRRVTFEPLECRHMLSASTLTEAPVLAYRTDTEAYVAQEIPTSDALVPEEFIPELRRQLLEETTNQTSPYDSDGTAFHLSVENESIYGLTPAPISDGERSFIDAALAMEPDATSESSRQSEDAQGERSSVTTIQEAFAELATNVNFWGEAQSYSGGSGGAGGSGGSGGSGSSGGFVSAYLSGGYSLIGERIYCEGENLYIPYSYLPDGAIITATVTGIVAEEGSVLTASSSSGQLAVKTSDDGLKDADKTISISLSLSGTVNAQFAPGEASSFTATIAERPEFISFEDRSSEDQPSDEQEIVVYNSDSYRTYVRQDAIAGDALQVRGGAFEAKGGRSGESEETSTLRYCLVYSSPYFEIDSISGEITLKKSAEEIVAELGQYTTGLGVRVYESRMIDGQSGGVGSVWSDDASINVTISHWTVERNGNATAQAIASDGCSVDMLAKDCGLTVSEFKNWLTISTAEKDYVELFDGSHVAPENLTSSDVLSLSGQFAVPNVMYMAWFGEVGGIGKAYMNWSSNVQELKSLGFKVEVFNNDDFSMDDSDAYNARQSFLSNLRSFSLNKRLHGLYMMGHGGEEELDLNNPTISVPATIGSLGSNSISLGPQWSVPYVDSCSVQNPIALLMLRLVP